MITAATRSGRKNLPNLFASTCSTLVRVIKVSSNKWFIANRTLGYLVLAAGLFLVGSELYQYYFLPLPTWHH
jgi:hypothetical protein